MELTKELLLAHRRSLEADSIAISGAVQQIDKFLEILEQEESPSGLSSDSLEGASITDEGRTPQ